MKAFNTTLDKRCFRSDFNYHVEVRNKNDKVFRTIQYSMSFSIDEIYTILHREYHNKLFFIKLDK